MSKFIAVKEENIALHIHFIRGESVMLDYDLAMIYGVETRALKQAVKRNMKRFPDDFMFVLANDEVNALVSQNVIPSKSHLGGALPMAFTEQGVAMLSGILNSERAIEANIVIMRTFVQIRRLMSTHKALAKKIEALEKKYDERFKIVFEAIKQLIKQEKETGSKIGFKTGK
ncbi:MAG: ORF6N domain-containing protein [Candidatus Scalinduaceae bacterium]